MIKLDLRPEALQFQSRAPFYWIILGLVAVSLVIMRMIEDSRFGAYLVAVRENEDAAKALGVNTTLVKLAAMTVSAAIAAAGGCFYAQYFLFIDAGIAYGPWISIAALLAPIVGGAGTVFGPLLGALVVKTLGEATKLVAGDAPGLDLVIYGCVLILIVAFAPSGIAGLLRKARQRFAAVKSLRAGSSPMAEPLLRVEGVSKRFGGLLAVDNVSLDCPVRAHHRSDRTERRRQDDLVRDDQRISDAEQRPHLSIAARTSPACRHTGWRGAASPARSRSCGRLPG